MGELQRESYSSRSSTSSGSMRTSNRAMALPSMYERAAARDMGELQ
jgi:hypothetical protein